MMANTSAVDQVLWLPTRQQMASANRRKRIGVLVSAAHAGWIHVWNAFRGELLCKFRGTKLKTGDQVRLAQPHVCGMQGMVLIIRNRGFDACVATLMTAF
jgi:hypothetical protein